MRTSAITRRIVPRSFHPAVLTLGRMTPMGSNANPYLERGIAFKIEGRYEEAVSELQLLLSEDPNSSDGHYQLGLVYGFTCLFDESIEELKHAVTLAPQRTDIRYDLAMSYAQLGYFDEAKAEFEEVLRRDPTHDKALKQLAFFDQPV
jgi:tetratricopeptide (TPR) repeat protein